jgi:hypothetical protein
MTSRAVITVEYIVKHRREEMRAVRAYLESVVGRYSMTVGGKGRWRPGQMTRLATTVARPEGVLRISGRVAGRGVR